MLSGGCAIPAARSEMFNQALFSHCNVVGFIFIAGRKIGLLDLLAWPEVLWEKKSNVDGQCVYINLH